MNFVWIYLEGIFLFFPYILIPVSLDEFSSSLVSKFFV